MKQAFKFKVMTYNGAIKYITKTFDCPDFQVIPPKEYQGRVFPETTIQYQLMDWMDTIDKRDFMIENDLGVIINYWIPEAKQKKETVLDYLKQANLSKEMTLDLIAIYHKIKPILKGKSIESQIEILFSHLSVGYQAIITSNEKIINMLKEMFPDSKLLETNS